MNKQKNKILSFSWICLAAIFSLTACKKEIGESLPGNTDDVAFNFYIASDVMDAAYAPARSTVAIYVDKYEEQSEPLYAGTGHRFPTVSFGFTGSHEYPASNNSGINYARYVAGDHRLLFTDVNNTVVLDTTINTKAESFNGLYLADVATAANASPVYKLVVTEEDREVPEDKTGVRFINLSPDAGNLTCNLQKANGDLANTQAGELVFGQASAYQYFSADDIASGDLLRFSLSNAANEIKFDTGVPFYPGRSYVVVIDGFHADQQRQVAIGKNPDGSIKTETITIGSNLKAEIRRSY